MKQELLNQERDLCTALTRLRGARTLMSRALVGQSCRTEALELSTCERTLKDQLMKVRRELRQLRAEVSP